MNSGAAATDSHPCRVAYLVNHYPKVSHTFIRREIAALERLGVQIERFSIRGRGDTQIDPDDRAERAKTRYLLQGGIFGLLAAVTAFALLHPLRFLRGLWRTREMAQRSDRSLPYHLASLAEACRLWTWLRKIDVRHVHAHFGTNSAEVALLVHVLGGPTFSFTVHGPEEFDKPEFLGLAKKAARAAFVVAISSYGKSQLFRWLSQADWPKVEIVHCGLDGGFHGGAVTNPSGHRFVSVGRLCEQKGQLVLLEACGLLRAKNPDFELVLAGDGEMRAEVEAQIARLGLADNVRITGWITSAQVREELLGARALVLPSFAEGLPVAIMEALALQRPVISTYVAGIPELVRPGREGWLVPAGDAVALAAALEECLAAPLEQLEQMASAGRARVLERHDVDLEAQKLNEHFRAALGARV